MKIPAGPVVLTLLVLSVAGFPAIAPAAAQEAVSVEIAPSALSLEVGEEATLEARVLDANGNVIDAPVLFLPSFADGRSGSARQSIDVDRGTGRVKAVKGGDFLISAIVATARSVRGSATVSVAFPPLDRIEVMPAGGATYVGVATRHQATLLDAADDERDGEIRWSTSDEAVATVDRFGILTAHAPGEVALRAEAEGISAEARYEVRENPAAALSVTASQELARTGDVVRFAAMVEDAAGGPVSDLPVTWTVTADPSIEATADIPPAEIDEQGRFVAYFPGVYTVGASVPARTSWGAATVESSSLISRASIEVHPRHVSQEVTYVGQGQVNNERTSDLWVWEGIDGRDYAITGTHAAAGAVYFWDVTDPASPVLTDSVVVDARTTNDVKVSEDGEICVISREGASNRRNGIVILDCRDPRDVTVISTFDEELTGGVHNLFVHEDHVYAVNNGRRFDVINIEDPTTPHRVGRFELDTPGHAIHDIWIVDGIAYTSNWGDGVVLIDVGGGDVGGSPSNPVEIARFRDIGGRTHAAFPYRSPTGRFYVFLGDEAGRPRFDGQDPERTPQFMSGYIHVVDFTDPENPEEVARYEIPEAGSHNMWIEDDKLYAAFYNGGLRVIDISGELKGNLGEQGREIARYMAYDPDGIVANAPFTWGPQVHKGNLFFAEYFSGLWAVKLEPPQALVP
ncbi:Ig-like domain-containing protein [Candidatus Palauibacter sp.]|uniref:Ig-like domain-containing protein n=1 Tax=Candidatus Palauibacter sp. TaxID=3101350 RepID=UPI003B025C04